MSLQGGLMSALIQSRHLQRTNRCLLSANSGQSATLDNLINSPSDHTRHQTSGQQLRLMYGLIRSGYWLAYSFQRLARGTGT